MEKLRQDNAGITSRPIQRRVSDDFGHFTGVRHHMPGGAIHNRKQGEANIGPGITIRHRKHIDFIEIILLGQHLPDTGDEAAVQAKSIQVCNLAVCHEEQGLPS